MTQGYIEFKRNAKEMISISVPVLDEKTPSGYRYEKQPRLLPHRIMAYIIDHVGLDISPAAVNKFWLDAHAGGEPIAADLEACQDRIPLGLYGDGAQLFTRYRREKLMCLWLNVPIWRPRSVRYSRFLLWSCDASLLLGNKTMNAVLRWITWSCNCLYAGTNPTRGLGGKPLPEKLKMLGGTPLTASNRTFQVVEIRGDWEFHKLLWNFRCSWKSTTICFKCTALSKSNDTGLLYWNTKDDCTWTQQEFNTSQYISQRLPDRHICYLAILHISKTLEYLVFFFCKYKPRLMLKKYFSGVRS